MIRLSSIHYFVFILFNIQIFSIVNSSRDSLRICDQYFQVNNCYYFACIDAIYQCGRENLLVQFSYTLCKLIYS